MQKKISKYISSKCKIKAQMSLLLQKELKQELNHMSGDKKVGLPSKYLLFKSSTYLASTAHKIPS